MFGGSSQWRYRDRIAQQTATNFCHLLFSITFRRGRSTYPAAALAEFFDIPELAGVTIEPSEADPTVIA